MKKAATLRTMNLFSRYRNKRNHVKILRNVRRTENNNIEPAGKLQIKANATFQSAMKFPIIIAQCFGLFPVLGVSGSDVSKLRFKKFSVRFLYSILSTFGQCVMVVLVILKSFKFSTSFSESSSIVFYTINSITGLFFLKLATQWSKLCQHIAKTEALDPIRDKKLAIKCNIACFLVLILAAVEHILAIISGLAIAIDCQPNETLYKAFMYESLPFIWAFLPYEPVAAFLAKFINIQCTFNWNFADAFVICISLYLSTRLEQINQRILSARGKYAPSSFYRTAREDYCRIIALVRKIDDAVNSIIFFSFGLNLFIICLQLLNAIEDGIKQTVACRNKVVERPFHGYEQAVYFLYSFTFLLIRSLTVSLVASQVHTASRRPAEYLYDVPSTAYCHEVQRFLNQVHGEAVALTGLQFFNVTRGLVLTITGTVITYELVLMQLTSTTPILKSTDAPTSLTSFSS